MQQDVWKLTFSVSDIEQQTALENNGLAVYNEAITNKKIVEVVNKELFLNWFMERIKSVKDELSKVKTIKKFKINSSYDKNGYNINLIDPEIDMLGPKFSLNAMQVKETESEVSSGTEKSQSPKSVEEDDDDDEEDEDYEYDYELHHFDKDDNIYYCRYEDCDKKYKSLDRLKKHLDDKEHYADESYEEDEEEDDEDLDEDEDMDEEDMDEEEDAEEEDSEENKSDGQKV